MSDEANRVDEEKTGGVKYLVYADLLPQLQKIAALGFKPKGGCGWAVNFVLRQFANDAIAMLERSVTQVAHFRFWINGFCWEIKVTAPSDSPQANTGLQIDPRSIFNPQVMGNTEITPVSSAPSNLPVDAGSLETHENPLADLMSEILS